MQTIAYFAIDALFAFCHPVAIVIKLLLFYIIDLFPMHYGMTEYKQSSGMEWTVL